MLNTFFECLASCVLFLWANYCSRFSPRGNVANRNKHSHRHTIQLLYVPSMCVIVCASIEHLWFCVWCATCVCVCGGECNRSEVPYWRLRHADCTFLMMIIILTWCVSGGGGSRNCKTSRAHAMHSAITLSSLYGCLP